MNLERYVKNKEFDFDEFDSDVKLATIYLNEILDEGVNLHPLEIQRKTVEEWKAIGLGVMNFAGTLFRMECIYGSQDSKILANRISRHLLVNAFEQSCDLNPIQHQFENLFESDFYKSQIKPFIHEEYYNKYPRNCQLLTIAPTGSISTMIGASSGGMEPAFALSYTRTTKSLHDKDVKYKVFDPIVKEYIETHNCTEEELPKWFITSDKINYNDRIDIQSMWQSSIDASISSTLNLDESITPEEVFDLYIKGWKAGCKGLTIFRRNCKRVAILDDSKEPKKEIQESPKFDYITPVSRKKIGTTCGSTFCKKCACGTLFITTNRDQDGNIVEVFTHTSKGGICQANLNAETRMISLALRSGVKVDEIIDQLKGISCPACTAVKAKGGNLDGISCADIIAKTITEFKDGKQLTYGIQLDSPHELKHEINVELEECPECHEKTLRRESGCRSCSSCGWSACG